MKRAQRVQTGGALAVLAAAVWFGAAAADAAVAGEPVDLGVLHQIKQEALRRSKLMEVASTLTDVHGPRLTGSPQLRAAGDYLVKNLRAAGLKDARLEKWGPFGRGWSQEHFEAHITAPHRFALVGYPKAWTPGTAGRVSGEAIQVTLNREEDLKTWEGKLKGKFVLMAPAREPAAPFSAQAKRLTDAELADLTFEADPNRAGPRLPGLSGSGAPGGGQDSGPEAAPPQPGQALPLYMSPPDPDSNRGEGGNRAANRSFVAKRMKFLIDQGVLAVLEPGRGDAGFMIVGGGGPRDPKEPPVIPQIVVATEHYGRIVRTLAKKLPVTIEMDVRNKFHDEDQSSFNVIADLPGRDKRAEVVMLGAHLDSWHSGTGATDNAAGVAIVVEAARILATLGLPLRRTVRVALWTGEEQGLHGSRAYVKAHFADRKLLKPLPEHARLSAYFNLDNGTGAIRGVFAQSNDAAIPIFEAWCAPLKSLGVTTVSPRNTGGTDHLAFDEVGLPGFQFIQDPVDYSSRTHHTSVDTYERLQAGDLMKNAAVVAAFAYHAANRADRLPRKPMPKLPPRAQPARPAPAPPAPGRPATPTPQAQPASPAADPRVPS
jgi:carboxypeptidase Q